MTTIFVPQPSYLDRTTVINFGLEYFKSDGWGDICPYVIRCPYVFDVFWVYSLITSCHLPVVRQAGRMHLCRIVLLLFRTA